MRNLKRALSLVMAMALIVGMMVVSASAASKDFTDSDEIRHTEAVSAMTTLNVISGKEDGSYFDPTGTLTRAEMAKLVTYILNGGVEPVLGEKVTPTYKDIDGHWAEKYIEYCTSMNIIAGDGTGKFNPEGTLTAEQCAKMLLTAMNYKDDIFGFLGNDWAINVNREANSAGLYKELGGLAATSPITRDDAAQMVYNAIQAKTMKLTWTQDMSTGEISQTYALTGNSLFTDKFNGEIWEGVLQASGNMDPYGNTAAGKEKVAINATVKNGDEITPANTGFKYAEDLTGLMGQYVKVLYNTRDKVAYGVYSVAAENGVVINTTIGALSDIGKTANTLVYDGTTYDVDAGVNARFYNGTAWENIAIMSLGTSNKLTNYDNVKLVDNDGDDKIDTAIVIDNQIEKVTYVGSDSITLTNKGQVKASDATYTDLAVNDYVAYVNAAYSYDNKAVLTKANTLSGEVSETSKNTSSQVNKIKVDGEWYTLGQVNGSAPLVDSDSNALNYNSSYDLVLYNNYVVHADKVQGNGSKIAVITGKTSNTDYDSNTQVRLLLADGTTVEGYAKLGGTGADTVGDLVTYTIKDGVYQLKAASNTDDETRAGYDVYTSADGFTQADKKVAGVKVNDSAVVFVQYDKDLTTSGMQAGFKVITGSELNSWKANYGSTGEVMYNTSGLGYADVVYIVGAAQTATPGIKTNTAYVTSGVTQGSDATGDYSAFTIWDGSNSTNVIVRTTLTGVGKGTAITFDWDGENELKNVTVLSTVGSLTYSNGKQVKINTTGYDLADDVTIINVSTKDNTGVAGSAIATAAQTSVPGVYYNNCWYKLNGDGEVELLIIDVTSNKLVGNGAGTVIVGSVTANDIKNSPDGVYYPTDISSLPVDASQHSAANMMVFKFTANSTSQAYTLKIGTTSGSANIYDETSSTLGDSAGHFFYVDVTGSYNAAGSGSLNGTSGTALTSGTTYYWQISGATAGVVASGSFVAK